MSTNTCITPNVFYNLGKRDCLAWLFMQLRSRETEDERAVLRDTAQQLIDSDSENPNCHAVWYLKNKK